MTTHTSPSLDQPITSSVLPVSNVTPSVFAANNITTHVYDTYEIFIHPHWYQYGLISPAWHYAMGIFITFVSIFGALGNLLVMYIFGTTKTLRTPSNMFIVNLSMSDFIFSIIQGFPLMTISCFTRRWIFGKVACELYGLVGGIFGLMSINTLAAIAIDRYNVIARPIKASRVISYRKAFMMLVFVWCWSTTWTLPPLFGWGSYILEGFQTSCTFDYLSRTYKVRASILCLYICGFTCPLTIILFCYFHIYKAVAKHEKEMGKMAKKLNAEIRQGQGAKKSEIKTAKIAMTIILTFLLSWLPYATVALIARFGPVELVNPYVSELPVMFAKASAMHNPLIYALSHPKFRDAVDKRFPWLMCCCRVTERERETASSTAADRRSKMKRMDSVNSTVIGGPQSQLSEISNLDSDTIDDTQPSNHHAMRMKSTKERSKASPEVNGKDNLAYVRDFLEVFAKAMATSGTDGQKAGVAIPTQMLATLNQDPHVLQQIYAISNGNVTAQPGDQASGAVTSETSLCEGGGSATVISQPSADAPAPNAAPATTNAPANTEADEKEGSRTNKAFQTD
nr:GQ-rhodopsin 1 [Peronia verruculata]